MAGAAPAAEDWGLYVNECAIFATRIGVDRWADFLSRVQDGRLTMLSVSPGGGEWHVMCGTREAAQEAHETFMGAGFHKSHIKTARLSACKRAAS
jgi:tRNA(Phe) wybutosine-synthesizing methylase Tyw3